MKWLAVFVLAVVAVEAVKLPLSKRFWRQSAINQNMIDAINNDPTSTWTAGVNSKFASARLSDVKPFLGVLPGGPKLPPKPADDDDEELSEGELPAAFDWRADPLAAKCPSLNEVRDQSDCGSCWAFGAAEAMTDRICIASNGTKQFHVSAADLVACCVSCGMGCDGGYPESAWAYWKSKGLHDGGNYNASLVDNGCYSYPFPQCEHHVNGSHYPPCPSDEYPTPKCPKKCNNSESWAKDVNKAKSAYGVDATPTAIATEIYNNGPVEAAFTVYQDFLAYKSGVYVHKSGPELGGHAIKILGWGSEGGADYWLVANSWNDDWGDGGYFKIAKGTDECGIEDDVVAGKPK